MYTMVAQLPTCYSSWVPDPIFMSSQAGRALLEVTEVGLQERSQLRHTHYFTMGEPVTSHKPEEEPRTLQDRKSTRLNSSHL